MMFNVTRRQALAASGGLVGAMLAPKRFASAAGNTLTIAYNVNLPSFDPDGRALRGQSDHPGDLPLDLRPVYRRRSRTSRSSPAC